MNEKRMNLIFLGSFVYPQGMAGTKRIQHATEAIKSRHGTAVRVIAYDSVPISTLHQVNTKAYYMKLFGSIF